ncbi:hypothetical protein VUR80DRAFT_6262 [Thermomyces stellatus]
MLRSYKSSCLPNLSHQTSMCPHGHGLLSSSSCPSLPSVRTRAPGSQCFPPVYRSFLRRCPSPQLQKFVTCPKVLEYRRTLLPGPSLPYPLASLPSRTNPAETTLKPFRQALLASGASSPPPARLHKPPAPCRIGMQRPCLRRYTPPTPIAPVEPLSRR